MSISFNPNTNSLPTSHSNVSPIQTEEKKFTKTEKSFSPPGGPRLNGNTKTDKLEEERINVTKELFWAFVFKGADKPTHSKEAIEQLRAKIDQLEEEIAKENS